MRWCPPPRLCSSRLSWLREWSPETRKRYALERPIPMRAYFDYSSFVRNQPRARIRRRPIRRRLQRCWARRSQCESAHPDTSTRPACSLYACDARVECRDGSCLSICSHLQSWDEIEMKSTLLNLEEGAYAGLDIYFFTKLPDSKGEGGFA